MSESLKKFAAAYRATFEELKEEGNQDIYLRNFPGGCCSLAVEMMCSHLQSLGWKNVNYTGGRELNGDGSHSWLTHGNVIVDITADQFDEKHPTVYVGGGLPLHGEYEQNKMDVRLDLYDSSLLKTIRSKVDEKLQEITLELARKKVKASRD